MQAELDDRDSQIQFPQIGDDVSVLLGWEHADITTVFEGTVDEVKSVGSRGSGQTMAISARGVDVTSKVKNQVEKHSDKEQLKDAAQELAKDSDISEVRVAGSLQKIKRKWWALQNESFIHWGKRIAGEIGANFQVNGKTAAFTPLLGGTSASGRQLTPIRVRRGDGGNLHAWELSPILGRPRFKKTQARWFDFEAPEWKEKTSDTNMSAGGGGDSETQFGARPSKFNEDEAQAQADGDSDDSERNSGEGHVEIEGEPMAQPGAQCMISGVRQGVDGSFLIDTVNHTVSRGGGFTTSLGLKHPQGSR